MSRDPRDPDHLFLVDVLEAAREDAGAVLAVGCTWPQVQFFTQQFVDLARTMGESPVRRDRVRVYLEGLGTVRFAHPGTIETVSRSGVYARVIQHRELWAFLAHRPNQDRWNVEEAILRLEARARAHLPS